MLEFLFSCNWYFHLVSALLSGTLDLNVCFNIDNKEHYALTASACLLKKRETYFLSSIWTEMAVASLVHSGMCIWSNEYKWSIYSSLSSYVKHVLSSKWSVRMIFVNFLRYEIKSAVKCLQGACLLYIWGLLGILTILLQLMHWVVSCFKSDICVTRMVSN